MLKVLSVGILTVVFCLAMNTVSDLRAFTDFHSSQQASKEQSFSGSSTKSFHHAVQSESGVINLSNIPVRFTKNTFKGLWLSIETGKDLLDPAIARHQKVLSDALVNQRKSEIIFPFHCFW